MSDLYVESYKKSVTHILDYWNKKLADFAKQLEPIDDELDDLNNNNKPSDDDKKRIAELEKKRADIRKQVEAASMSLKVNLSVIDLDDKANKTEALKLPDWLKKIIKEKGLPLGKDVSISADVSFDFKAMKLTKFVPLLKWNF
jgi:hypothetical protein